MMMSPLGLAVIVFAIALMVGVVYQVAKGRLLLRYSFLWLLLALVALICALFPQPLFSLAYFLGFNVASNFVLFVAIFLLLLICLSLSVIVSKQQQKIKDLIQDLAILKNDVEGDSHREENL